MSRQPIRSLKISAGRVVRIVSLSCLVASTLTASRSQASDVASAPRTLEEPPNYGMYYDTYEPSFYTGFAPRTLDPRRIHVHLGRGNQLRVTVVLADDVLQDYAKDLLERDRTYRSLIDSGHLVLTQNRSFEEFERALADARVAQLVAEEPTITPGAWRERNLELMERLNPGRVFRLRMPVDEALRHWAAQVQPEDRQHMDAARQLQLVNLMLPTRLFVSELTPAVSAQLAVLVNRCPDTARAPCALEGLRPGFLELLQRVTGGIYPVRDGVLQFDEFTAIYPVGTFNEYTLYHGRQIPEYPTPGRRALTTHQRTQTADHVPIDDSYSYFPWLPYMHVGPRMHNAVHTLYWKMETDDTSFLPASWRSVDRGSRSGQPYRYLWLLSRGPMSHGCTHLNAGHISELRQLLPSDSEQLYQVDIFLNGSTLYDVFDIDGDFQPEVMGVRYFIAYALKGTKPDHLRVRDERHAYYDWLYGGELQYGDADQGVFQTVRDCQFVGRQPIDGAEYTHIPLREADYQREQIQFYRLVDIPFARELRQVSLHHPFPGLDRMVMSAR